MNIMTQFRNWMAGVWAAKKTEQVKKEIAAVVEDVVDIVDEAKEKAIEEVKEKIRRLGRLTDLTVRPFLIHAGQLAPAIIASDYFDTIVSMGDLLGE